MEIKSMLSLGPSSTRSRRTE